MPFVANKALSGSGANNPKYSPFSENSQAGANYEYLRLANSVEDQLSKNAEAEDRIQRDIFVIGLNDTYKRFRSDVISRETFATLTFAQAIAKAQDFEDGLKTESFIAQHHL